MPSKSRESSKGKSKKGRRRKKAAPDFPVLNNRDLLNPFKDRARARYERQKVFRRLIKNHPLIVRNEAPSDNRPSVFAIPRPVPAVADTDEYLVEVHNQVFHSDPTAKPNIGEENDTEKTIPARDGGRLNTLSVKEVRKETILIIPTKFHQVL